MQCYRHPKTETAVSCGRCERPLCPKCMVPGPVGMRCRDCASLRQTALYQIPPVRVALVALVAIPVGIIGAFLLSGLGFFVFFLGPLYGGFVAECVLRAAGRKRGLALEIIGVGSIVLGGLLTLLPRLFAAGAGAFSLLSLAWPLIGIGLAVSACYARLKYL